MKKRSKIDPLEWTPVVYPQGTDTELRDILITMMASIMQSRKLDSDTKRAVFVAMKAIEKTKLDNNGQ